MWVCRSKSRKVKARGVKIMREKHPKVLYLHTTKVVMKRRMRKTIFIAGVAICIICAAVISYGFIKFTQRDAIPSPDLALSEYPKLFAKEAVIVIGEQTFKKSLIKNAAQASQQTLGKFDQNDSQIEKESAEAIAANLEIMTGNKPEIISSKRIGSFIYILISQFLSPLQIQIKSRRRE